MVEVTPISKPLPISLAFLVLIVGTCIAKNAPFQLSHKVGGAWTAECSKISSTGCNSFNELIDAQDTDILDQITEPDRATRVCFVDGEDEFFLISFSPSPSKTSRARFSRYTKGTAEDTVVFQFRSNIAGRRCLHRTCP